MEYIGVLRKRFLERTVLLLTDFFMHKSLYSSDFTFLENEAFESVVTSFESALLSSPPPLLYSKEVSSHILNADSIVSMFCASYSKQNLSTFLDLHGNDNN